jgi:DNA-binding HxlR family transcriptional regulator
MFGNANPYDLRCPSRDVLELVGSKWGILILCVLQAGPQRTGVLRREVDGISQKMLTQTLRDLERDGIVHRRSYPEVPPRVEYELTALGRSLAAVVAALERWVVDHYGEILAARSRSTGETA